MQPIDISARKPVENETKLRYSHQAFRPEAVEAYTTRQAGEPWDAKSRFEGWIIAGLTVVSAAAITFVLLGGH